MRTQHIIDLCSAYVARELAALVRVEIHKVPEKIGSTVQVIFGDRFVVKKYVERDEDVIEELGEIANGMKELVFGELIDKIFRIKEL